MAGEAPADWRSGDTFSFQLKTCILAISSRELPREESAVRIKFHLDFSPVDARERGHIRPLASRPERFSKNLTVMPGVRIPEREERRLPRQCNWQKKGSLIADSSQGSRRAPGVREH